MKYKKRSIVIEAIQFFDNAKSIAEISDFIRHDQDLVINYNDPNNPFIKILTPKGNIKVKVGEWIVEEASGEFCSYGPDIFESKYEKL